MYRCLAKNISLFMDQNSFSPIPKILKVKFKRFFSLSQFCSKQEKTFLVGELIFMWFLWKRKNYNQDGSDDWIMFRILQFSIFWSTPWILLKFWESIQNDATKLLKKYCMLNQLLTVNHAKYKLWRVEDCHRVIDLIAHLWQGDLFFYVVKFCTVKNFTSSRFDLDNYIQFMMLAFINLS